MHIFKKAIALTFALAVLIGAAGRLIRYPESEPLLAERGKRIAGESASRDGRRTADEPSWEGEEHVVDKTAFANLEGELIREIMAGGLQIRLCLYDYALDEWISLGADQPLYPASMIKTLLLLTALEQAEQGFFSLAETHRLEERDKYCGDTRVAGTGILQYTGVGTPYTFEELLYLMVSRSDNVATNIVFDRLGQERCAATARRLGLKSSAFTRKMYDLQSGLPSNTATAYELTQMLLALQDRKAAGERLTGKGIAMMAAAADKGRIGRYIGDRAVVANKVGTVSGVVGDMALLYFPEKPPLALTIVVENPPDQDAAAVCIGRLALLIVEMLR